MARNFNTTGPCRPELHYMLPPEARLPDLWPMVEEQLYFVLHAPRQTGKTTAMMAFAARLRERGVAAVWATIETSQGFTEVGDAEPLWIEAIEAWAERQLPVAWRPPPASIVAERAPGRRLNAWLSAWAAGVDVPLVLLLDEADVVTGPALISLLRQLRDGFMDRGVGRFPVSVGLIGMRDLRDWLTQAKGGAPVNPGSPFNIKISSVTLRGFTQAEVEALVGQHRADTGQPFLPAAIEAIHAATDGQPFLVNALARACVKELVPDRSVAITAADVDRAREALILSRTTHLDALAHRLREPRVAAVIQAVLLGDESVAYRADDFQYVVDLGLVRKGRDGAVAANPIYREVLVRELAYDLQANLQPPWWPWARPDGGLDMPALVDAFRQWWRENADILPEQAAPWPEAVPHLAFMAFLQRVVNGGGRVHREFAAGRGAVDLLVEYGPDRFVIELKRVRERDGLESVIQRGLAQTTRYLDSVGLDEGWLVLFDVRAGRTWEERLWTRTVDVDGRRVHLVGA